MFYAWLPSWLTLPIVRLAVCFGGVWMHNFKWFVSRVKYSSAWFCFVIFFTQMEMIFKIPFAGMLRKLLMHLF